MNKKTKLIILTLCTVFTLTTIAVSIVCYPPKQERIVADEMHAMDKLENQEAQPNFEYSQMVDMAVAKNNIIKWVDFSVTYEAMAKALELDIKRYNTSAPMPWVPTLAILACKYGGNFASYKQSDILAIEKRVAAGENLDDIGKALKNYNYYKEAYQAVLGGFVGEYQIQVADKDNPQVLKEQTKYGLKAFSPIAKGFSYTHSDDFGVKRSYGFARKHLGHDMMGSVGTPIIAVESGVVEAVGWNQYGGWRVGIRSFDGKRYYYYAHLRKGHPYHKSVSVGQIIMAGNVIGYMGMTGYSRKEDVNNINVPHLHWGMQLVFDESQKEALSEIWIDIYAISKLLSRNAVSVYMDKSTKDYYRKYSFAEKVTDNAKQLSEYFAELRALEEK